MKYFIIILFAFFSAINAQSNQSLETLLQDKLDELVISFEVKGISAAFNIENDYLWKGVSGYSDPTDNELITSDMIFEIGSVTKTFTAALILKLKEENKLSLDDSLHKYLPQYENINSDATIRQLLNHTSGLFNYTTEAWIDSFRTNPGKIWTPEEVINAFVEKPNFEPGTSWEYSNTNYLLLGLILENITGSTYHELLRNYIFDPLNLSSMFLEPYETSTGVYSDHWFDLDGDGESENLSTISKDGFNSSAWAAGSISSTAEDMAKWGVDLFNLNFLSPESVSEMIEVVETGDDEKYYGLGIMNFANYPCQAYGHSGQTIGYTSVLVFDAVHNSSLAVVVNQDSDIEEIGRQLQIVIDDYFYNNPTSISENNNLPNEFTLKQNYPNPFNPATNIEFSIPQKSFVTLKVFDILGNKISTIISKKMSPGNYKVTFDASELSSGIYFYKLTSQNFSKISKMVLLK